MSPTPKLPPAWRPDRRFWISHLLLPLAVAGTLLTLFEWAPLDLWLADRWYDFEGQAWSLRDHWLTYDVIHHWGKMTLIAFGVVLMGLLALGFRMQGLRPWRTPLAYLLTSMILLPSLIASAKRYSPIHCPWDLARYGGEVPYQHNFSYTLSAVDPGHCFPAGHASGGFALLAVYFSAYLYAERPQWFLLPGLFVGTVFALGQQARGAHFLSHDLWTASICWFGALVLFLLFRPHHWPQPQRVVGTIGVLNP